MSGTPRRGEIVAIGEVLWDSLPAGLFPGGAVFNVCYHLTALGHGATLVSSVGDDVLGEELRSRMEAFGMSTAGIAVHPELPTGRVLVRTDEDGIPAYDILAPAAWDRMAVPDLPAADLVLYGSLAQRSERSRLAVRELWARDAIRCFDVNLRPPYDDAAIVKDSLAVADFVKMNDDEFARVYEWTTGEAGPKDLADPDAARSALARLADQLELAALCVTRGAHGAVLLNAGSFFAHPGFRVRVGDTVGAGDAFLAGFLDAYFRGVPPAEWLEWSCRCGAYVAARAGATPPTSRESVAAESILEN